MSTYRKASHHKAWVPPMFISIFLLMTLGGQTMTTIQAERKEKVDFFTTLAASDRSPEIPALADVYGWLVGSWELDVRHYGVDVAARHLKGEVHFARVLEGRAVQDVWIMPRLSERSPEIDKTANMF